MRIDAPIHTSLFRTAQGDCIVASSPDTPSNDTIFLQLLGGSIEIASIGRKPFQTPAILILVGHIGVNSTGQ